MDIEEDDYGFPEHFQISFEDEHIESDLLKTLFEGNQESFLEKVQSISSNKQEFSKLKKEVNKLQLSLKQSFYEAIYCKVNHVLREVENGNTQLTILKDKNLLEFLIGFQKPKQNISEEIYQTLKSILKKVDSPPQFTYIFNFLGRIAKNSNKNEELAADTYNIISDEETHSDYVMKELLKSQKTSEEVKILLELKLIQYLRKSESMQYQPSEELIQKKLQILKVKPFKEVLHFMIENEKFHTACKKLKRQIMNFTFHVENDEIVYQFHDIDLHPDLQTQQTIIKTIKESDQKVLRHLNEDMIQIGQNKVYLKFTMEMIKAMQIPLKNEPDSTFPQIIFSLIQVLKKLPDNQGKPYVTKNREESEEYFVTLFHIFVKYLSFQERDRSLNMSELRDKLSEDLIIKLMRVSEIWMEKFPGKEFTQIFTIDVISLLAFLFYRRQFQFLTPYQTQVSKILTKILFQLKEYPLKWKKLKKIKAIIDRWGETVPEDCKFFPLIMEKFLDAYFTPGVSIKVRNANTFQPMFASRSFLKFFSSQFTKKILAILAQKLKVEDLEDATEDKFEIANEYLYKISLFYSARILAQDQDKAADFIYMLYKNYAHCLPILHSFRTWIIHNSTIPQNNSNSNYVTSMFAEIVKELPNITKMLNKAEPEQLLNQIKFFSVEEAKDFNAFMNKVRKLTNSLELKAPKEQYGSLIYQQLLILAQSLSSLYIELEHRVISKFNKNVNQNLKFLQAKQLSNKKSVLQSLNDIQHNLKMVIRFYICNIARLMESKDEVAFIRNFTQIYESLIKTDEKTHEKLNFLLEISGISELKRETHLEKSQISRRNQQRHYYQNNSDKFLMKKEDNVPINIISVLYSNLRPNYINLIKNLISLSQKDEDQKFTWRDKGSSVQNVIEKSRDFEHYEKSINGSVCKNARLLIKNILFPSMTITGECWYNGKLEAKAKQQYAFGIYWDQFVSVFSGLTSQQVSALEEEILLFLDICHSKDRKIIQKSGQGRNLGLRRNHRVIEEINQILIQMGCTQDQIDIALENVDPPEPEALIDWIQNNHDKIQETILKRVTERSLLESTKKKESEVQKKEDLLYLNYGEFIININKGTKKLIKLLVPELFKSNGNKIKDLIFICLDSFKDEKFKDTKYKEFIDRIVRELDELNHNFDQNKLSIIVGSIDIISSQMPNLIPEIHIKQAPLKLLTFIDKADQEAGEKTLKVVNKTLPTPSEAISEKMTNYMNYIADVLLNSKIKSSHESQILFKLIKARNEKINKKVLNVVCEGLRKGCIKKKIFSLLSVVLDSEPQFSSANIEFDLKMFIIENHGLQKNNNLIEIQTKKFSRSFVKHEENPLLQQMCKKIFLKKKNKTSLFYDKTKHDLYKSEVLDCHFLSYEIPTTARILVDSLVNLIVTQESADIQAQYIEQLYKTIQFYKILIPYCMQVKVGHTNFFSWLIKVYFPQNKNSISFITFLFVRNGLFYNKDITYSDYLIATLIKDFLRESETQNNLWVIVEILYLMQIKNFNQKSNLALSHDNPQSLKQICQDKITIKDPIKFIFISELLYLNYKFSMIEKLSGKYRVNDNGQFTLEKQFINMDLFYRKVVENQSSNSRERRSREALQSFLHGLHRDVEEEDLDQEQYSQNLMNIRNYLMHRNMSRTQTYVASPSNISNIFVPIQPPPSNIEQKEGEKKEENIQEKVQEIKEEKKELYLMEIFQQIDGILPKNVPIEFQFEAILPTIPKQTLSPEEVQNKNYSINIKERTQLGQNFNKTQVFKDRINDLIKIADPQSKKLIMENKNNPNNSLDQPRLRIQESGDGGIRQLFMLERMMLREQFEEPNRRRQENNQQINMGPIMNIMNEYQEPPPPEVEKKEEPKQQQKQKVEQVQEEKPQMKEEKQQMKEEKQQEKQEEKQQQNKPEEQQKKEAIEEEKPVQKPQQRMMDIEEEHMMRREEDIMVEEPMMQENEPVNNRQILTMLGLPQTFLQQVGLDPQMFDQLPEDLQIQQLNHYIAQRNQQQGNQGNEGGNQGNSASDIQNQNAAFILSLDPQLRAQTLMEATPQFLLTLPPELRAQAQNHRQRYIGQMIEEEQYEEEEELYHQKGANKGNLVYPDISHQMFDSINENASVQIAKSIFLKIHNYRNEVIRILLENKKTQKRMITTLIAAIKNIDSLELIECNYNSKEQKWAVEHLPASGASRKFFIIKTLDILFENSINCIYKDEDFLKYQFNYENFFKIEMEPNADLQATKDHYYPIYELLDLSIDFNHQDLTAELIKKVNDIPEYLCRKIIRGIKDDKFNSEFYKNLNGLSENQIMKKYFASEFSFQKPPKFEILAKLMKYEFCRLPYLKKLHIEALKKFNNNRNQLLDFLIQIYRAYSLEDLKEIQEILLEYKAAHFQLIKYLYESGRTLDDQPIKIILKLPHLLDFQTKRFLFQNHPKLQKQRGRMIIEVNRMNIFQESYNQIMSKTPRELQGRVKVVFVDEPAQDAGGVKKQWFLCVSREIFNRQYALFSPSSSGNTYQPNPKSFVNPEHLNYYKFIGRFAAKALTEGMLIDAFFTRSFYKMILGQELEFQDLQEQDYSIYQSMKWFKQNPVEDEDCTFSYVHNYFGKLITKELIPNGANIYVNQENKQEYIQKYSLSMMRDSIHDQIQKFLEGFYEVLPKECISFFEAKELQLLMSGMPSVDLEDLRQNTQYSGYSVNDPVIKWYWEILEEYSNQDLAKLIQFITGTSKIPLEGFSQLEGMNGLQKISIHRDASVHQLPKSHTCFNQLDLPNYPSKELLKERLRVVLTWGSEGFGFM